MKQTSPTLQKKILLQGKSYKVLRYLVKEACKGNFLASAVDMLESLEFCFYISENVCDTLAYDN